MMLSIPLIAISSFFMNVFTEPIEANVKIYNGAPTLFINGEPNSSMVYMTYRPDSKYFQQFGKAGVHIYSFSSTPSESGYGLAPPAWIAPDKYDYSNYVFGYMPM